MNSVVHFEMPAEDRERAKKFYSEVFGWNMVQMGPETGDYVLAQTTETDEGGMVKKPGAINGGFYQKGKDGTTTNLVISVDDLEKHMGIVKEAGGTVEGDPVDIPGVGRYVMIHDTEDNRVGMLQPVEEM